MTLPLGPNGSVCLDEWRVPLGTLLKCLRSAIKLKKMPDDFRSVQRTAAGNIAAFWWRRHMLLNVDKSGPRAAPFTAKISERLAEIAEAHADLPAPNQVGSSIALPGSK